MALFERRRGKIPIFIELRQMNSIKSHDLVAFIFESIVGPGGKLTREQFASGLKAGLFVLILDGFDEIDFDWKSDLEQQVFKLQSSYPKNWFLVSSRPDERFSGWHSFAIFEVQPMEKREVLALIRKVDYEKEVKQKFIKALNSGMYELHASFLSSPLLAIMMLLTFDQFATIPDKIHVFYDHAFDALFSKHDASKQGGYRRRTRTNLAIDDFKRCLSAFSAVTYAKGKVVFSDSETRDFLKQAFSFEKIAVDTDNFVQDLVESVCVLQRDGLLLTFSHRSFQEYFTAYFICRSPTVNLPRILDQFTKNTADAVLPMSFAMNQNLLEREWVLPKLGELNLIISKIPTPDIFEYLNVFYVDASLGLIDGTQITLNDFTQWGLFRICLYRFYTDRFDGLPSEKRSKLKSAAEEIKKRLKKDPRLHKGDQQFSIRLNASDNKTLAGTWLSEFVEEERGLLQQLQKDVEISVEDQGSILSGMLEAN